MCWRISRWSRRRRPPSRCGWPGPRTGRCAGTPGSTPSGGSPRPSASTGSPSGGPRSPPRPWSAWAATGMWRTPACPGTTGRPHCCPSGRVRATSTRWMCCAPSAANRAPPTPCSPNSPSPGARTPAWTPPWPPSSPSCPGPTSSVPAAWSSAWRSPSRRPSWSATLPGRSRTPSARPAWPATGATPSGPCPRNGPGHHPGTGPARPRLIPATPYGPGLPPAGPVRPPPAPPGPSTSTTRPRLRHLTSTRTGSPNKSSVKVTYLGVNAPLPVTVPEMFSPGDRSTVSICLSSTPSSSVCLVPLASVTVK